MNIAIDWDDTITRDPETWLRVVCIMRAVDHKIYLVTMRAESEKQEIAMLEGRGVFDGIFYTDRRAKAQFMFEQGINIHVWIDDQPNFVINNAQPRTLVTDEVN